jgi:hypothetical protein
MIAWAADKPPVVLAARAGTGGAGLPHWEQRELVVGRVVFDEQNVRLLDLGAGFDLLKMAFPRKIGILPPRKIERWVQRFFPRCLDCRISDLGAERVDHPLDFIAVAADDLDAGRSDDILAARPRGREVGSKFLIDRKPGSPNQRVGRRFAMFFGVPHWWSARHFAPLFCAPVGGRKGQKP